MFGVAMKWLSTYGKKTGTCVDLPLERRRLCLDWSSCFNELFSAIHELVCGYTGTRCRINRSIMTGHRPYTFENRTHSWYRFDSPLSRWDLELGCDEKGPLESARVRY